MTRGRTRASSTEAWPPSSRARLTLGRSLDLVGDALHDGVEQLADEVGLGGPGHDQQGDRGRPEQDEGLLGRGLAPFVESGLRAGNGGGEVDGQVDVEGDHQLPTPSLDELTGAATGRRWR